MLADLLRLYPALMYHHVRPSERMTDLCVSSGMFESQLRFLAEKGIETAFVSELVETRLKYPTSPSHKLVALTFDDGYADNYFFAYPILKKFKMKATIFLTTSLISSSSGHSPDRLNGHSETNRLWAGGGDASAQFLSWEMISEMCGSGLVEMQSHGHAHDRQFSSNRLVAVAGAERPWFLPLCTQGDDRPGLPLFETASALSSRRFQVQRDVLDACAELYRCGASLPVEETTRKIRAVVEERRRLGTLGELESRPAYQSRIHADLSASVAAFEKNLGTRPGVLAYPWGAYCEELVETAKNVGFRAGMTIGRASNGGERMFSMPRFQADDDLRQFQRLFGRGPLNWREIIKAGLSVWARA